VTRSDDAPAYDPPRLLKAGFVQTVLASSSLRALGPNPMVVAARRVVLDAGGGVRLLGFLSRQDRDTGRRPAGLVVLIHGWEGSERSAYIRSAGRVFFAHGYDVFRLDLRDHGDSHHLNRGLFYAVLLDEVFEAVRVAVSQAPGLPAFLVGFSLGGSFVLRIARRCREEPIDRLRHVAAISPVLDPARCTERIDSIPLLRAHFLKKWRRSLRKKQRLYPATYDFTEALRLGSVLGLTEWLVARHSSFASARDYFAGYTLLGDALSDLGVGTTIVTAADDPIIPASDFAGLQPGPSLNVIVHPHGGHNGFFEDLALHAWYERWLLDRFRAEAAAPQR
jgi:hypothetical protein